MSGDHPVAAGARDLFGQDRIRGGGEQEAVGLVRAPVQHGEAPPPELTGPKDTVYLEPRRTYRLLGLLMVLLPLTVLGVHLLLPRREDPPFLFFVEAAGVYVFAAFWAVKSREIAVLARQ